MSRPSVKTYLSVTYALTLVSLVAILASLQYQWTGEASRAERQRMQGVLRETLAFMERSIDLEVSRAILTFWREPQEFDKQGLTRWQDRYGHSLWEDYERWHLTARHPRLVQQLYVAEIDGSEAPRLFRLRLQQGAWEGSEWPEQLKPFRELLARQAAKALSEEDLKRWASPAGRFLFPITTLDVIPAFVAPLVIDPGRPEEGTAGEARDGSARARIRLCVIIWMDREYLTREWLPGLAAQHLTTEGVMQYDYLVKTRRRPEQVICSSANAIPDIIAESPDASIALLQLRLEETAESMKIIQLENAFRERGALPRRGGGPIPSPEIGRNDLREKIPEDSPARRRTEEPMQARSPGPERRMSLTHSTDQIRGMMETVAANGWQLMVKHRAGSVDAAVARVRMRNLYVSLGILLVLAVSLVFLAIAVRSARQLARQQMEFVASISHELRTPVTAICSLSENLADGLIQPEEQIRRYGRFILREGRRLGSLVEQALEFAGLSSGRLRCRLRPLTVEPVLREALQSCEAQLQEKNAQVDVQIETGLPRIAGDPESLSCAAQNLIGNAVKYSRDAGAITFEARHLSESREIEIVVSDHGIGIDADELNRVFEPFFRGRNALSSQIRGAGIGLSLVKRIVDAHNGRVLMTSRPGEGTRVTVRLPVIEEDPVPAGSADNGLGT